MDFSDNAVLIESLKKGKEEAYMYLLDKYHRKLYAYAISLIDNHAQAQDIVQNVLIKTWQSRKTLNSKYSIQSFLYKSNYNEFVNTYEKDKACKQIFSLSKKEGLTNVEISEYLNISIKTVEVQITIAYNKLRDKLGDKLELLLLVFFPSKQNLSAL